MGIKLQNFPPKASERISQFQPPRDDQIWLPTCRGIPCARSVIRMTTWRVSAQMTTSMGISDNSASDLALLNHGKDVGLTCWLVFLTHLKNMQPSNWKIFPKFNLGENSKNTWNHHPGQVFVPEMFCNNSWIWITWQIYYTKFYAKKNGCTKKNSQLTTTKFSTQQVTTRKSSDKFLDSWSLIPAWLGSRISP